MVKKIRKVVGCAGSGVEQKLGTEENIRKISGNGNIQYFDEGIGYMSIYIFQNSLNYTLRICTFRCMWDLPEKKLEISIES